MYLDYILFAIGFVCLITSVVLIIYLFLSRKRVSILKTEIGDTTTLIGKTTVIGKTTQKITHNSISSDEIKKDNTIDRTILLTENIKKESALFPTEYIGESKEKDLTIDISVLEGKYILEQEIHEGGMSKVFIATNVKLGNKWIVKFVDKKTAKLTNEEDILKRINHTNLPDIVDIFHSEDGVFIVESFIEGSSLAKVLEEYEELTPPIIIQWFEEMLRVLHYLHTLEPEPIIHCDLKPSNIMITPSYNVVLIDFGVSKQVERQDKDDNIFITYRYAAPEQLKNNVDIDNARFIERRFGTLPDTCTDWTIDARTDIYTLGTIIYELIMGDIPSQSTLLSIRSKTSKELSDIILKCLEVEPQKRYNTAEELLLDLQRIRNGKIGIARFLVIRRVVEVAVILLLLVSTSTIASGAYINQNENLSLVSMEPNTIYVTEQQISEIYIEKKMPNGDIIVLDPELISWSYSYDNIIRLDGSKIVGLNEGVTEVIGKYRNKMIKVVVNVIKPIDNEVDISLMYREENRVNVFAGDGERDFIDGERDEASFVSPESIVMDDESGIFIVDSGKIRKITNSNVETIYFEPSYITADKIKYHKGFLYVLTNEWEDGDKQYYGIVKLGEEAAEGIYLADAVFTRILDFDISSDDKLYFIESNVGMGENYLRFFNLADGDIQTISELTNGTTAITLDDNDNVYFADKENGVILKWDFAGDKPVYIAGVEGERHLIDGNIPMFYEPRRIHAVDNKIFVLDFNVIRMIVLEDGLLSYVETLAGEISTEINPETVIGKASDVVFAHSSLADFLVSDDIIFLTDPKKSVVYQISVSGNGLSSQAN